MSERTEAAAWTAWGLVVLVISLITLSAVGFGLSAAGVLGSTIVEREVYEQSYQRQAAVLSGWHPCQPPRLTPRRSTPVGVGRPRS